MEKKKKKPVAMASSSSSYSWWFDYHNINNIPHQSQWLQATLSELDAKIKMMLSIIEEEEEDDDDGGDTFTMRAEKYYKSRPQLIKMIQDLHLSYRSLAHNYDQLLLPSQSNQLAPSTSSNCNSSPSPSLQLQHLIPKFNSTSSTPKENYQLLVEAPNSNCEPAPETDDKIGTCKEMNGSKEGGDVFLQGIGGTGSPESITDMEMQTELRIKVSMLVEDNLKQQAELIKRNNEKREAIKDLCVQIGKLMNENRALKTSLACCNVVDTKQNKSQVSRLKCLLLRKCL